jgi:TRAP-type C4-dicarboxylate transport system substrate-binding protein
VRTALLIALTACATPAAAEHHLKMAAIAPDGTSWARELRALTRDIEVGTGGAVHMKWYLGGIAGDELTALKRVKAGQLDGLAGAAYCERLAPSLRVLRMVGLIRNHDEMLYITGQLRTQLDAEMEKSGFVGLAWGTFGGFFFFTRNPIASMADMRRERFWVWSLDEVLTAMISDMGAKPVGLPIEEAAAAYDDKRNDGFLTVPTAALAYQWSARTRYFTELNASHLPGCLVISRRAFDALSLENQQVVRTAAAKFTVRFNDLSRSQDRALLGGLLEKQGIKRVPVTEQFKREFQAAADQTRARLGATLVPKDLLDKVTAWLAERRSSGGAR